MILKHWRKKLWRIQGLPAFSCFIGNVGEKNLANCGDSPNSPKFSPRQSFVLYGTSIPLTTDIWTSRATQSFATTTAQFLDQHWNLTTFVLETVHFPGHHTGILILQRLKEALAKYDVTADQISAVLHDEAANAVLAGKQCGLLLCIL